MPTKEILIPSDFTINYPKAYETITTDATAVPSSSITVTGGWNITPQYLEWNDADATDIVTTAERVPHIDPKDCMISDKFNDHFVCPCLGCCACTNVTYHVCEGLRKAYKRGLKEGEI